ncbi:uncharacterized protein [Dermacentor albipictus]|uniref:uncharacterized protein isoform X2 n=1 Tax=Dermacentor albipictus TaxID=60249 RepID=UPI0038FCD257
MQFMHIAAMAAADHTAAPARRDDKTRPAASDQQDAATTPRLSTSKSGGLLRRRHGTGLGGDCGQAAARSSTPWLLEEARPLGCSRYDVVKGRMYRLLYATFGVTFAILVCGLASVVLDWHHGLGVALIFTGVALVVACWAVFLCSCAERSRTFLAAIAPSYLLDPPSAADADGQRRDGGTEDPDFASPGDVVDYKCL